MRLDEVTQQEKESQDQAKKIQRYTHSHYQESHKTNNLTVITRMQRFWCRTMPALHYASVNPYEPCLLDTVGHVLLVPPNPSELYIFPPSSKEFPNILQEGPDGDLQFKLSLLNVSLNLCTRPHLLMEEASTLTSGQGTYQGTVIFLLLFLVIPAMKNVSFFL